MIIAEKILNKKGKKHIFHDKLTEVVYLNGKKLNDVN